MVHPRALLLPLVVSAVPAAAQQVASIQLSHSSLSMPVGGRQTVFATAYGAGGAPIAARFQWTTSDQAVVLIEVSEAESDFAELVAVGPGTASVTVRAGGRAETVGVSVVGAAGVVAGTGVAAVLNINPPTIQLLRGETDQLRPVFLRADGEAANVMPVTWSSLNPGIASVDAQTGVVVGIATGQGAIQATAGSLSKIATVEVADHPFSFSVPVLGLSPDAEATIDVVVPSQRNRTLAKRGLTWRSTNEQIVRVSPLGVARGVGPGRATIVVEGYGQVRELPVTVHRPVAFVDAVPAFSRGPIQVPLHGTRPFQVTSKAADETPIPEAPVRWAVADTTLAQFDPATGLLTGRVLGTTTLEATPAQPVPAITWEIHVIAGGIQVVPDRIGLGAGESVGIQASFTTEDGTPVGPAQGVQWTSDDPGVVTVDGDGRITGVAPGRARVVVTTQLGRQDTTDVFVAGALLMTSSRTGSADLFAVDLSQPAPSVRITDAPSNETMGAWSPDGSRIAFVSDRDGNFELYVADADGANPRRLTRTADAAELSPEWMPDGREIVYTVQAAGGRLQLWIIGADGGGARALTTEALGANLDPAVSPDGQRIAFTSTRGGGYDVFVMNRDGSDPQPALVSNAKESRPVWITDGELLLLQERTVRGRPIPVVVRHRIGSGTAPQLVTPLDLPVTDLAVSPVGDHLVLEVSTPGAEGQFERRLYVLRPGAAPTPLPREGTEQQSSPAFRRPPTQP
jgi:Tol biopolymer transport system component